ncbi:MAG TPA: thiolase family protein [Candidatus Acidoferrales bacterium]|nr:thiolase family protein [Candidatus Acidoferrales bacterium]
MRDVYIVSGARTPIGKFGGAFLSLTPMALGAHAMRAALARANIKGADLDLYIFGNVLRAGWGQLVPRQAALAAGIPDAIDGYAIDMVCSSAMMSLASARQTIASGDADLVLAGGFESMTRAGFVLSSRARWGLRSLAAAPENLVDVMTYDGLSDPTNGEGMGDETERLAREYGVTRAELDAVAVASHERAARATRDGTFAREIAPVEVQGKKGAELVDKDEGIRPDTTLEVLSKLRSSVAGGSLMTAGNSSQISDGAAALLLASERAVKERGLQPLGKILGSAWSAGPTWRFAEAPIPAVKKLLAKIGLGIGDIDLFENNEAFALSTILFERQLGVSRDRLNVNGGAIALGHPIGATGARLVLTALNALGQHGKKRAIAALCHGTGGGTAMAIERI